MTDPFGARRELSAKMGKFVYYDLNHLEKIGIIADLNTLPFSIKVLLEAVLRNVNGFEVTENDLYALAGWKPKMEKVIEIPFKPARVVLQDFTGVPALVDLAAMRSAIKRLGGDPQKINPHVQVDLVIDHSVQVDFFGDDSALRKNAELEFQRNRERYEFLRWGQNAFDNFRVVPPATGIIHQVNLEYLAKAVLTKKCEDGAIAVFPDTLVGTDSHTTMINGLGVLGWGVGGIEAEAVMLGQPLFMVAPEVVGFKLFGKLREGVTATDLTLTVTQMLREHKVVEKFVEFYGEGLSSMSLEDRASIANMAPEYGATMGFFPIDCETLNYLKATGRSDEEIELVEKYTKAQGLFRTKETPAPEFSSYLELNLGDVVPSLAGPKRPQDRIDLSNVKQSFLQSLSAPVKERGFGLPPEKLAAKCIVTLEDERLQLRHGTVVIAAITSCTNTSNPSVLVAAGLLAKKAVEKGLTVPKYVKTSLAPGSKVVTEYLKESGLLPSLEKIGFDIVGYGCTTCIGNSGPLPEPLAEAISKNELVAAAVLSGNRNFEGRVNPHTRANYLASPPLVVAYALAGNVDIDLLTEPIGTDPEGNPVFLKDLWPSQEEIGAVIKKALHPEMFLKSYDNVWNSNETWNAINSRKSDIYDWDENSSYIAEPPFFTDLTPELPSPSNINNARVLALLGDSVTTDHISPAGVIPPKSPAERYLFEKGIERKDFNSFGSRRGNDAVMVRGTFGNIRLKNLLLPGVEGGETIHIPSGERVSIFDAAMRYKAEGISLIIVAGKEYGTGSSRDWAAKGTLLLGVKAVIAESFERIHRSNLVGMGVLPLQFINGENVESLKLSGSETYTIEGIDGKLMPGMLLTVKAVNENGEMSHFQVKVRLDTPVDIHYYRNGGILHTVLRNLLKTEG
ncbi:MAG TPA: aconitate hydratase AcnA [Candidatus Marinimicrobia bacterium]|nr:aconitate hydratase AcnA [Candidatus Neomarinimicrobiota bacterium]